MLDALITGQIVMAATGVAEFGRMELGTRILRVGPHGEDIRYRVLSIRRRQMFIPFAPLLLVEHSE